MLAVNKKQDALYFAGTNVANLDTSPVATTTEPDLEIKTQEISETTSDSAWQNPTTVIATSSSTLSTRSHLRPNGKWFVLFQVHLLLLQYSYVFKPVRKNSWFKFSAV